MKVLNKSNLKRLFWGSMLNATRVERVSAIIFTLVSIAALSFCQLAFFPIGEVDGNDVYLLLMLAPLFMGAVIFGPLASLLMGAYTGAVLLLHASVFPLDYYEVYYFMYPANTLVLFTVIGLLAGCIFYFIFTRSISRRAKLALVALVCLALSFLASTVLVGTVLAEHGDSSSLADLKRFLLISPVNMAVQAVVDALAAMVLCLGAGMLVSRVTSLDNGRRLPLVFQNWMLLISSIIFMVASSVIFSYETLSNRFLAEESMESEVAYIAGQLAVSDDEAVLESNPETLLSGYSVELDGHVVITDSAGTILTTNDPARWPIGGSYAEISGYSNELLAQEYGYDASGNCLVLDLISKAAEMSELQALDDDGHVTMNMLFVSAADYGAGYAVMMRDADMVYASRSGTMLAATLLAILLIVAIGVLANVLLRNMVVRHINETNSSLEKITCGNLDERVRVQETVEFTSLSAGINTTVSALKDTIAEAEQRNAQDLATAKAIQESSLPREFPPFPEIDCFDVYASMKTAKEVGGDFYDFFLIEEDGRKDTTKLGFLMADVSGKGIPAALFMMTAKTQLRNYLETGMDVAEAVTAANHQMCIGNDEGMFVTAWVAVLDYSTGAVSYINAGHNPPLLLHDGEWQWLKDVSGMPLGLFDGIPYQPYGLQMEEGDVVYAYTDGVTEAMDADGRLFGEGRLEEVLRGCAKMNPRSIGVCVRRALTDFTLDAEQSDDITMLALKYGVPPEKKAVMVLPARADQLVHVVNFIHEELDRRRAPRAVYGPLDVAAEELFVNVCHYAYPDASPEEPGEVRIGFEYEANPPSLTVTLSDDGVPYNPLAKPDAVTPDNIDEVPIGGLGILMAKRSVDEMSYERRDGSNVLVFTKKW